MTNNFFKEKQVCEARLENGEIVEYDLCGDSIKDYDDVENKEYLGKGTCYSVGRVKQTFTEILHFWKWKS